MTTEVVRQAYSVLPTPTDLVELSTRDVRWLAISVTNLDGTQTVDVTIVSAVWAGDDAGESSIGDLVGIQPGQTKRVDLRLAVVDSVILRATASGIGCDVRVSARTDRGRR